MSILYVLGLFYLIFFCLSASVKYGEEVISNGVGHCSPNHVHQQKKSSFAVNSSVTNSNSHASSTSTTTTTTTAAAVTGSGGAGGPNAVLSNHQVSKYSELDSREKGKANNASLQTSSANVLDKRDYQYMENHIAKRTLSVNDFDETDENCEKDKTAFKSNGLSAINAGTGSPPSSTRANIPGSGNRWNHHHNSVNSSNQTQPSGGGGGKKNKNNTTKEITNNHINCQKDDYLTRLDSKLPIVHSF